MIRGTTTTTTVAIVVDELKRGSIVFLSWGSFSTKKSVHANKVLHTTAITTSKQASTTEEDDVLVVAQTENLRVVGATGANAETPPTC